MIGPLNGSRIVFHKEFFFRLAGGLEHFADSNSIPQSQPTIFHWSQIETEQQTSLLLFCVPLFSNTIRRRVEVR